jgi:pimeloyl-ACP methyl ester carboxylesterase
MLPNPTACAKPFGLLRTLPSRSFVIDPHRPVVVIVPGLWMPTWMMMGLQQRLTRLGHRCLRFRYPSGRGSLDENAQRLCAFVRHLDAPAVHFVGHSMGGLLALHATVNGSLGNVRRIAMLASPYNDCCAARGLGRYALGRRMLGKTISDWLSRPKPAVPAQIEVGVLAGTLPAGLAMLVVRSLATPHDGVVCASETAVPGMCTYAEVRVNHFGMILSSRVATLVNRFLTQGCFEAKPLRDPPTQIDRYALHGRRES